VKKVLLLEPNYSNKYPPMGLMKIATYYRKKKYKKKNIYDIRFFKGDLSSFAAELLCEEFLDKINKAKRLLWAKYFSEFTEYIRTGKSVFLELVPDFDEINYLSGLRDRYKNKDFPKFDIICITTLFTFYWKETIDTIHFAKFFRGKKCKFKVGGIAATILPQYIKEETKINPHTGLWKAVDNLPLDYSILEETYYEYLTNNAYFAYMTRGCVNKCKFCAVPKLEPKYINYVNLRKQIKYATKKFGNKRNLLLMDNNVFASSKFDEIIDEIKELGFGKNAKYNSINEYEIAIKNLRNKWNERAYIKKIFKIYEQISEQLSEQEQGKFYLQRENFNLLYEHSTTIEETRNAILEFDEIVSPIYEKLFKQSNVVRYVDFNQGLDARLAKRERIKKIAEINIRPLRIAFDHWGQRNIYKEAIYLAKEYGITNLSNYLLYNFKDKPEDLYNRMKLNVDLCEKLDIAIYSFPMKYHPIEDPKYFRNRDFIGIYWCKKYIRAVQAVLNSTKGKIGRGREFFEEAFGRDVNEFNKILLMPETFIIYRRKYDEDLRKRLSKKYGRYIDGENDLANEWWNKFCSLSQEKQEVLKKLVEQNQFNNINTLTNDIKILEILKYYTISREEI